MKVDISNHAFQRMEERKGWDKNKSAIITEEFLLRFQNKYKGPTIKKHYLSYDGDFYWVISTNRSNGHFFVLTFTEKRNPPRTEFF